MTYLPHNITRCHGMGCPVARQCLRHVAPTEPGRHYSWVASALEPGEPECRHLIPFASTRSMTTADWENIARCAKARCLEHADDARRWIAEWCSWQAAQELSGRCPF